MKKYLMLPLAVILSCLSWVSVQAEQAHRQFKTWTVETPSTPTSKTGTATAQLKKALAAKQQAAQAQTAITKPGAVTQASASVVPAAKPKVTTASRNVSTTPNKSSATKKWQPKTAQASKTSQSASKQKPLKTMPESTVNTNWRTKVTQQRLKQLGYMTEAASGKMTSATEAALKKFQEQNKLKTTGKLDEATYHKVEWVAFSKSGIKNLSGTTVVREAAKYKGVKYVFGGTTPKGFDCSGYVQYVFKQLHAKVTRTADTQALEGVYVSQKQLKPGDLVFFSTYEPGASHVGIYAGNGRFWNATSSRGVALCGLQEDYWRTRYYGARRILVSNGETNK